MTTRTSFCHWTRSLIFTAVLLVCWMNIAISAGPSLEALHPPVGSRGTVFTITAKGFELRDALEVLIPIPQLECIEIRPQSNEEVQLQFRSLKDCPLGAIPLRLRTPKGTTELRTLTITPFPILNEGDLKWNSSMGPVSFVGTLSGQESDIYNLDLKAGELFSAEVHAVRLGVNLTDTKLSLLTENGQLIHQTDDHPFVKQDPAFSAEVIQSCTLQLQIASTGTGADADSYYVLHLGGFPRPAGIFPMGTIPGDTIELNLLHELIPANQWIASCPPYKNIVASHLPNSNANAIEIQRNGVSCPSLIPFRNTPADFAHFNYPSEKNQQNIVPLDVGGIELFAVDGVLLSPEMDHHIFFRSTRDGPTQVELYASRLGSLLDAVLQVRNLRDEVLSQADDVDGHDPRVEFEARAKEVYKIVVQDKRKQGGPLYSYRLEVGKPIYQESLFLAKRNKQTQYRQSLDVPIGNRVLYFFGARKENVALQTNVRVANLPDGVYFRSGGELPRTSYTPIVFEASPTSTLRGGFVQVDAEFMGSNEPIRTASYQQTVDLVSGPADAVFQEIQNPTLAYSISESVPFRIELQPPTLELPIDGTLGIKVVVTRQNGFRGPLDVTLPLLPEWVDAPDKIQILADQSEGTITLRSMEKCTPIHWSLVAEASVGIARGVSESPDSSGENSTGESPSSPLDYPPVCSSIQSLSIGVSPCKGNLSDVAAEQGTEVTVRCLIELDRSNNEEFFVSLEGLPNRVIASTIALPRVSRESGVDTVDFQLTVAPDAPVGTFEGIFCRIRGNRQGQEVSYCVGRGAKLNICQKGKLYQDSKGRPLSPLQVLRMKASATQDASKVSP